MRSAAAADADVVHTQVSGRRSELGHLEARAEERIECERKHASPLRVPQRLIGRLVGRRSVWHRLCNDGAVDCSSDRVDDRQHRLRAARAVEPDDIGASVLQPLTSLVKVVAVKRLIFRRGEADERRQSELLDHFQADERLAHVVVRLGDDEVGSLLDRPADLLAVHLANDLARLLGRLGVVDPRVADVAGYERVPLPGHFLRQTQRLPVERLEVLLASDHPQFLPMPVVGECDHHLSAGAKQLTMKLAHGVGKIEHRLRHVRTALQVTASLQLE